PASKSWDAFMDTELDLVITVCGNAANETCPIFPGTPLKTHWGLPDPAHASGTDVEVADVFQQVFEALRDHIQTFVTACEQADVKDAYSLRAVVAAVGAPQVEISIPD
ncbi:MAG: hypothetical protein KJP03_00965, partial [Gammaproteobacteria bacterium]|nr:hypothetical protein [Gammaproteobacteria bacterium]